MNTRSLTRKLLAVAAAIAACCTMSVSAGKPDHTGGGGNSGDSTTPSFSVIELPVEGDPVAISDPGNSDVVVVAISGNDAGKGSAAFAIVDRWKGTLVSSGLLPEPLYVDPVSGNPANGPSDVYDVNGSGTIVGYSQAYDPDSTGDPNPHRATVWVNDGNGYSCVLLPLLTGTTAGEAIGTNETGDVVGYSRSSDGQVATVWYDGLVATLWDAFTMEPSDLNTDDTAAQGWELVAANDINEDGLIAGTGLLNGVQRGFVLDRSSGSIWAVPLVGAATQNNAGRINAAGRVTGDAWNADGDPYGTNPDYYEGYVWEGPGTDPVVLPSVTLNTSIAHGQNDFGAVVGHSIIPIDGNNDDTVPTLWTLDGTAASVTDLQTEIPTKPSYALIRGWDVNNDGWVSVYARKPYRGGYAWPALLLVPTGN